MLFLVSIIAICVVGTVLVRIVNSTIKTVDNLADTEKHNPIVVLICGAIVFGVCYYYLGWFH